MLRVKKARTKAKTFPLLLGDLLALYLLKTFKMPPLYLGEKKKKQPETEAPRAKNQETSVPSFVCKYFAQA